MPDRISNTISLESNMFTFVVMAGHGADGYTRRGLCFSPSLWRGWTFPSQLYSHTTLEAAPKERLRGLSSQSILLSNRISVHYQVSFESPSTNLPHQKNTQVTGSSESLLESRSSVLESRWIWGRSMQMGKYKLHQHEGIYQCGELRALGYWEL